MQEDVASRLAASAKRWMTAREHSEARALGFGQILFTLGWSSMWAASLDLLPFVPIGLCLVLMIAGVSLPALRSRRLRASASAPVQGPDPGHGSAEQTPARIG
ncbi:hypothetical protein BRAS3843_2960030 [Bradyrhizobium sp. STM 3843]|uniref:hypothetical protein n=1 Tax=Bradyrhizobium sp. STM 3843 TaxID=551947 RepID=UPI00024037E2|nr:hypothetical protein [Bradyrhizobium sp. STM 3843]CCE09013.1 hypothetical protein BRAS3843_2960030 [Bradyrhizobium sp. STM 3843]